MKLVTIKKNICHTFLGNKIMFGFKAAFSLHSAIFAYVYIWIINQKLSKIFTPGGMKIRVESHSELHCLEKHQNDIHLRPFTVVCIVMKKLNTFQSATPAFADRSDENHTVTLTIIDRNLISLTVSNSQR